jgi:hypothetical protein
VNIAQIKNLGHPVSKDGPMKTFLTLLILFSFTPVHAKFASWVAHIPCDKLILKVSSCQEFSFSNRDKLTQKQISERKELILDRTGAIVTADIEKMEAIKCHDKQDMDLKRYTKREYKIKKFFVKDLKCSKDMKQVISKRINFFCDTPGDNYIPDCFISKFSRKNEFVYSELIK